MSSLQKKELTAEEEQRDESIKTTQKEALCKNEPFNQLVTWRQVSSSETSNEH